MTRDSKIASAPGDTAATKADRGHAGQNHASTRKSPRGEGAVRKGIIATALALSRSGLSPGRSGNVSARVEGGMLITPSGMAYESLEPKHIVFVSENGDADANAPAPSSEWRFHLSAYKARHDRAAVVHTHSLNATILACAHRPIPAFHYMVAVAGGDDIPLVPYAPFGTEELAMFVAEGLARRDALLMANHGQIAIGKTLASALELANEVETLAAQYLGVLAIGKPKTLAASQMRDVLERFKAYGANAQKSK